MIFNQNLSELESYLKSQKIFVDIPEFKYQIETHPDYPSLLAISDTLTFFNIPNMAAKIFADQIENLPNSFMALLGDGRKEDYLAYITEKNGQYQFTHEKNTKNLNKKELKQYWRDVVFLAEKPEDFADTKLKNSSATIMIPYFFVLLFLGVIYLFSGSLFATLYGAITTIGIFLSVEALKTELGIESKVSKNMCNIVANSDCSQIINSDKNKWLKNFKISDISIWFFGSQLFSLTLFSVFGAIENYFSFLIFVLALAIPMTLYSIFFQYKVEKKWCPICLSIIVLVYIQLTFSAVNYSVFSSSFTLKSVLLFVLGLSFVAFLVYMIKPLLLNIKKLKEENIKNLRFKRNYSIFKNKLEKEEQQFFENENLVLGNLSSKLKISVITSPLCGYCKEAHEVLHEILKNNHENLSISIRFNYSDQFDESTQKLFFRLVEIHQEKGDFKFSDALQYWFESRNINQWLLKYGEPTYNEKIKIDLQKVAQENESESLNFTPNIFINQYKFPDLYERKDLQFFVTDLIEESKI